MLAGHTGERGSSVAVTLVPPGRTVCGTMAAAAPTMELVTATATRLKRTRVSSALGFATHIRTGFCTEFQGTIDSSRSRASDLKRQSNDSAAEL